MFVVEEQKKIQFARRRRRLAAVEVCAVCAGKEPKIANVRAQTTMICWRPTFATCVLAATRESHTHTHTRTFQVSACKCERNVKCSPVKARGVFHECTHANTVVAGRLELIMRIAWLNARAREAAVVAVDDDDDEKSGDLMESRCVCVCALY